MTGPFDLHARSYDARTGGFLSVDPLIGALDDPQQHNHCAYARGNPENLTDPTGLTLTCTTRVMNDQYVCDPDDLPAYGPSFAAPIGPDPSLAFGGRGFNSAAPKQVLGPP